MAQYIEEYNKIIKNTYSNNCEDLGISIYEYDDDYVPIIYIDNTSSLLPTLPHICDNQKYYKTHRKNILILGFQFLMKKMKKRAHRFLKCARRFLKFVKKCVKCEMKCVKKFVKCVKM